MEIERKFLIKNNDWENNPGNTSVEIQQGYLAFASGDAPEVRVRIKKNNETGVLKAALTIKSAGDMTRMEVETIIDVDAATQMLAMCQGVVISKTRHNVTYNNQLFEVDIYGGVLDGLAVAEIELSSEKEAVDLPSWIGEEVTTRKEYKNGSLARLGHPDGAKNRRRPTP